MCYFRSEFRRGPTVSVSLKVREPFWWWTTMLHNRSSMSTVELQYHLLLFITKTNLLIAVCFWWFFFFFLSFFSNRSCNRVDSFIYLLQRIMVAKNKNTLQTRDRWSFYHCISWLYWHDLHVILTQVTTFTQALYLTTLLGYMISCHLILLLR